MNAFCLTLLCPPAIEEKLLDLLLLASSELVFTSTATAAHGVAAEQLSAAEQVRGRADATAIQVIVAGEQRAALLGSIREQFSGTGIRYWLTPIVEAGEIA